MSTSAHIVVYFEVSMQLRRHGPRTQHALLSSLIPRAVHSLLRCKMFATEGAPQYLPKCHAPWL